MKVEESPLTGESVPVDKTSEVLETGEANDISLGDRKNMVYMATTLVLWSWNCCSYSNRNGYRDGQNSRCY